MKKNKFTSKLEQEKLKLRVKQLELEKQIHRDWEDLKFSFTISNLFSLRRSFWRLKKENGFFSEVINYGIGYLITKVADKTIEQIETNIKKGIEKLKTVFNQ